MLLTQEECDLLTFGQTANPPFLIDVPFLTDVLIDLRLPTFGLFCNFIILKGERENSFQNRFCQASGVTHPPLSDDLNQKINCD